MWSTGGRCGEKESLCGAQVQGAGEVMWNARSRYGMKQMLCAAQEALKSKT